ncbi:MAG: penicillin-binding protein 1A [Chitinivibrionales bacterium]
MNTSENQSVHYPQKNTDSPKNQKKIKGLWLFILIILAVTMVSFVAVLGGRFVQHMYATLPSTGQLHNIQPPLVTRVLDSNDSLLHEFSIERRFWVSLDSIPQHLHDAVIAIEDRRFYKHWGIDVRRIFGAIIVDIIRGHYAQGASTLTQQLARNVYLSHRQSLIRKAREALTAIQLERYYTKKEIMELYLNQVYLGAGVYGVQAASQLYFSKPVTQLNVNECAVLAGMIQLPEYYRPDRKKNLKRIQRRRNAVLRSMEITGALSRADMNKVIQDSIPSNPKKKTSKVAPYFVEMVRQYIEKNYGEKALYSGGLTIHTTLDPVAQDSAEQATQRHLVSLQRRTNGVFLDSTRAYRKLGISKTEFLDNFDSLYAANKEEYEQLPDSIKLRIVQASVVALEAGTGAIRALIGGRDFSQSKYNRAIQARRQPGSSFKPLVYTVAVDSGYTPATIVLDQPITLETPEGLWRPENYEREFAGPVTIRRALMKSINLPAIQVMRDVGMHNVINYARRAGLKHHIAPVPSIAIGALEATPMEMAIAYSIYPSGGKKFEPYFIRKIYDKNGRLLEQNEPEYESVISSPTAFLMASMMQSVVTSGTGASIPREGFTRPAAGKTGTTNDYSDAWFVGYTPQLVCAVWVGVDERRSMGHGITGSKGTVPIWVPTMQALHRDLPVKSFLPPEGITRARICEKSHGVARRFCSGFYEEYFKVDQLPDSCDIHMNGRRKNVDNVISRFGTQNSRRQRDTGSEKKSKRRKLMF